MASKEPSGRGGGRGQRSSGTNNYASTVATQSDVVKYRGKYKELKAKVKEIEMENDAIHLKTLNVKRTIQRMRLERAILYERLEAAPEPAQLPYHAVSSAHEEVTRPRDEHPGETERGDVVMDVDDSSEAVSSANAQPAKAGNGIKVTLRRTAPNGSCDDPAYSFEPIGKDMLMALLTVRRHLNTSKKGETDPAMRASRARSSLGPSPRIALSTPSP